MAYENLTPGIYEAQLVDWSCRLAAKIDAPLIDLKFEFEDSNGKSEAMSFQSFLFTREGLPNKKTINTLKTVGFIGTDPNDLNSGVSGVVDNTKKYTVTVAKNDKGYWNIDWVNDLGSSAPGVVSKTEAASSLKGVDMSAFAAALGGDKKAKRPDAKPPVKNHAPKAKEPVQDDDEIPF